MHLPFPVINCIAFFLIFGYTDIIIEDEKPIVEDGKSLQEYYEQKDGVIYKYYNIIDASENGVI